MGAQSFAVWDDFVPVSLARAARAELGVLYARSHAGGAADASSSSSVGPRYVPGAVAGGRAGAEGMRVNTALRSDEVCYLSGEEPEVPSLRKLLNQVRRGRWLRANAARDFDRRRARSCSPVIVAAARWTCL